MKFPSILKPLTTALVLFLLFVPGVGAQTAKDGDAFGKYTPTLELTAVRSIPENTKYVDGDSFENNVWTREYLSTLGIKLNYKWTVSDVSGDYGTKLNLSIVAGDLPDLIPAGPVELKKLEVNGLLADLTAAYDKYASPLLKQVMNDFPEAVASAKYNGKLYAIPQLAGAATTANVIWIRNDWLAKLKLSAPKTFDDVKKIAEAFVTKDPDGNGKKDTIGIAVTKDLKGGFADMTGIFAAYHAYPLGNFWLKDSKGALVNGVIQPEVKTALKALQDLYKNGLLDKEFIVKDGGAVATDLNQNKIGLVYGANWNPYWPFADLANSSKVIWTPYAIVSADSKPALAPMSWPIQTYYAVNKNSKYPEAVVKLANLQLEKMFGKTADPAKYQAANGIEFFNYPLVYTAPPNKDLKNAQEITDVIATKDEKKLTSQEAIENYKNVKSYLTASDMVGWGTFGQAQALYILKGQKEKGQLLLTAQTGADTEVQAAKSGVLDKLQIETFTKIIMGQSVDTFDKFVADWKKLGGDDVTASVNAAYGKK